MAYKHRFNNIIFTEGIHPYRIKSLNMNDILKDRFLDDKDVSFSPVHVTVTKI